MDTYFVELAIKMSDPKTNSIIYVQVNKIYTVKMKWLQNIFNLSLTTREKPDL